MIRSLSAPLPVSPEETPVIGRNLTLERLEQAVADGQLVWIDVVDAQDNELRWLEQTFFLHPVIVSDLRADDRRPTLVVYPAYLFLSLFQPHIHLNKVDSKEVHCVVGNNYLITVRKSDTYAIENAYERIAQNAQSWKQGAAYFLYLTAQFVIDAYYPLLDRISNQLNELEEQLLSNGEGQKARRSVYHIKQQLINLRQMVAPQREVLSSVIGEERVSQNGEIRDLFRHLYERLLRVYDVIDAQRDLSTNVLDIMDSQESNRLVEAVNRLTILSMIFLPLTFFTSLFELNFATTSHPLILPVSGGLMLLVVVTLMIMSTLLMILFFRRKGWL